MKNNNILESSQIKYPLSPKNKINVLESATEIYLISPKNKSDLLKKICKFLFS